MLRQRQLLHRGLTASRCNTHRWQATSRQPDYSATSEPTHRYTTTIYSGHHAKNDLQTDRLRDHAFLDMSHDRVC